VTPVVFGGGYMAIRTTARQSSTVGSATFDEDVSSAVRSWDSGVVAGAGIEVRHGRVAWVVDARYTVGFTALTPAPAPWKARSFVLSAGVRR
jgi:hypothetical protein